MNYRITLVESDEGWAVWCDDLPGCFSQGDTREEAIANIRNAITDWLAVRTRKWCGNWKPTARVTSVRSSLCERQGMQHSRPAVLTMPPQHCIVAP